MSIDKLKEEFNKIDLFKIPEYEPRILTNDIINQIKSIREFSIKKYLKKNKCYVDKIPQSEEYSESYHYQRDLIYYNNFLKNPLIINYHKYLFLIDICEEIFHISFDTKIPFFNNQTLETIINNNIITTNFIVEFIDKLLLYVYIAGFYKNFYYLDEITITKYSIYKYNLDYSNDFFDQVESIIKSDNIINIIDQDGDYIGKLLDDYLEKTKFYIYYDKIEDAKKDDKKHPKLCDTISKSLRNDITKNIMINNKIYIKKINVDKKFYSGTFHIDNKNLLELLNEIHIMLEDFIEKIIFKKMKYYY